MSVNAIFRQLNLLDHPIWYAFGFLQGTSSPLPRVTDSAPRNVQISSVTEDRLQEGEFRFSLGIAMRRDNVMQVTYGFPVTS